MLLAITIGQELSMMPYTSQHATPNEKMLYMPSDIPLKSFVLMLCNTCGIKAKVVQNAASIPMISDMIKE